ncbi:hypothetical protein GIB67_005378 [Kingdonia uniflora]|uniref:Uncharacterized protein n=1 Tax=Kingdonia uniflora TaxID=39325 RepID=A0A7J7NH52_9MAGN|nr:hypothetical protein GIB67_005378 [Kingdonia uniflora]
MEDQRLKRRSLTQDSYALKLWIGSGRSRPETIEVVMFRPLLPTEFSTRDIVKHWIAIFSRFDKVEVKALEKIMEQKQRLQQEMQKYMTLRKVYREQEKRGKKKGRKNNTSAEATGGIEGESVSISESFQPVITGEPELKEKFTTNTTATKRLPKPSSFSKQIKTKAAAIPPPLRNRCKRRMQPWMWVLLAVLLVRSYAMERLAEIFRLHCLKCSDASISSSESNWIPGKILKCFYDKDIR